MQHTNDTVKITILGTGNIANILAKTMKAYPKAELYAVLGIDEENANTFGDKYDIPVRYTSMDDALADDGADLVYVALPHTMHYDVTKKALLCGRNVLCEKPISINQKQAQELFALAKEKNLFLSEAMWTRFLPSVDIVQKLISDGAIGEVSLLTVSIGSDARDCMRMTEPSLGGGMLLDSGIYAITTMELILGRDISDIKTSAHLSPKGVDLHSSTVITYKDGKMASLTMSMDSFCDNNIAVCGDKGTICMHMPYNWANIRIIRPDGKTEEIKIPEHISSGYEHEVEAVCTAIQNGETYCEKTAPEKSLFVMSLMDKIRKEWGVVYTGLE